jgi:hypothetical protein
VDRILILTQGRHRLRYASFLKGEEESKVEWKGNGKMERKRGERKDTKKEVS